MKSDLTIYQRLERHNAKTFGTLERMNERLVRFESFQKKQNRAHSKMVRQQRRMMARSRRELQKWSDEYKFEIKPDEEPDLDVEVVEAEYDSDPGFWVYLSIVLVVVAIIHACLATLEVQ